MGDYEIVIDGSFGEGGGQILRSSLALSLITGRAFRMENIRSGRKKPGLLRQHLTAVNAAARIGKAGVSGNALGSQELYFAPRTIRGGAYHFAVGTAGSATLVLQAVLPALLRAEERSEIILEGGTHNPFAPPFGFLEKVFVPIVNRMGADISMNLERCGFFPVGGGRFTVRVEPTGSLKRIDLIDRGRISRRRAQAWVARLPRSIAERELRVIREGLRWDGNCLEVVEVKNSQGPGNVVTVEIGSENVTELFTAFGTKGVPAERVARAVVKEVEEYLAAGVPVGSHLADQLMIPMAMAGGGKFRTLPLTSHSTTNIETVRKFLDVDVTVTKLSEDVYEVALMAEKVK